MQIFISSYGDDDVDDDDDDVMMLMMVIKIQCLQTIIKYNQL